MEAIHVVTILHLLEDIAVDLRSGVESRCYDKSNRIMLQNTRGVGKQAGSQRE